MKEQSTRISLPPEQLYPLVQPLLYASNLILPGESTFWVMGFDQQARLLLMERLVTIHSAQLVPSTVFHTASGLHATQLVLCQQPITQRLNPTKQDWALVRRVMHIGLLLKIPLMDHLMINAENYVSFTAEGWLRQIAEELYQQKAESKSTVARKMALVG